MVPGDREPALTSSSHHQSSPQGPPPSTSASIPTSLTLLQQSIPSLSRRTAENDHDRLASLSVNQRITAARLEDRRRQVNLNRAHGNPPFTTSTTYFSKDPSNSSPTSSPSASSRAGIAYLQNTAISSLERQRLQRSKALKTQVAGPIPPESWREDFEISRQARRALPPHLISPSSKTKGKAQEVSQSDEVGIDRSIALRYRNKVCTALRRFYPPEGGGESERGVPSLQTATLCSVFSGFAGLHNSLGNQGRRRQRKMLRSKQKGAERGDLHSKTDDLHYEIYRQTIQYLPQHLKTRLMTLGGRGAKAAEPLTDEVLRLMWLNEPAGQSAELEDCNPSEISDHSIEDWDDSSTSSNDVTLFQPTTTSNGGGILDSVDLSFTSPSSKVLHRLLLPHGRTNVQLRTLSLAGWGAPTCSTCSSSLAFCSEVFLSLLSDLPGLECLSLAGSTLATEAQAAAPPSKAYPWPRGNAFNPTFFLRKLSRNTPRLRVLDLSHCEWVGTPCLLSLPWLKEEEGNGRAMKCWPRLEQLYLNDCPDFVKPGKEGEESSKSIEGCEDGESDLEKMEFYVGVWHSFFWKHVDETFSRIERRQEGQVRIRQQDRGPTSDLSYGADGRLLDWESDDGIAPRNRGPIGSRGRSGRGGHVVDLMGDERRGLTEPSFTSIADSPAGAFPTVCPVTGRKIQDFERNRAKILDLVRGRDLRAWAKDGLMVTDRRKWCDVWF
ncbi:hypothetical protein IE53DRAFT_253846 [Violaceomyces palustris]|uniref:Uncharacterized protein n=1 Tax=Violaceomyces palustris TaxID=1673888 RepID=A0ACD0P3R2_9BASI|nr:hypothetical protein IE53DRAFT_253846 [Violaceomyces palustris]